MRFPDCIKSGLKLALLAGSCLLSVGCESLIPQQSSASAKDQIVQGELDRKNQQALTAMSQRDFGLAKVLLEELVEQHPNFVTPYVNLGIVAEQQGDMAAAKGWYQKALQLEPNQAEALTQLGVLSREEGEFHKALDYYQRALQADESLPQAHYNLAILYELYLGQYEAAIRHYERYQSLSTDETEKVAQWISDLKRRVQ